MFNDMNNMDFSKMGDMLKEVQDNMQKMQNENDNKSFTAKSGGGMIKVSISGNNEVTDIEIDDSLLEDKESLQILLISAVNDAIAMLEADRKNSASQMLGGLGNMGDISKMMGGK